jgi:hypothetical protein
MKSIDNFCFQDGRTQTAEKNYGKLWGFAANLMLKKSKDDISFQDG